MEESKELQKLYGFMQAFIYITVCIEILLFVHFPFSEQIMPLLSKMAKIPIYSNILYSKLFTFFIIMVTCIGTRSKKDLELDPTILRISPLFLPHTQKQDTGKTDIPFLMIFFISCKGSSSYLAWIYPFAFRVSAQRTAPPAAPLTVLWESPMNL